MAGVLHAVGEDDDELVGRYRRLAPRRGRAAARWRRTAAWRREARTGRGSSARRRAGGRRRARRAGRGRRTARCVTVASPAVPRCSAKKRSNPTTTSSAIDCIEPDRSSRNQIAAPASARPVGRPGAGTGRARPAPGRRRAPSSPSTHAAGSAEAPWIAPAMAPVTAATVSPWALIAAAAAIAAAGSACSSAHHSASAERRRGVRPVADRSTTSSPGSPVDVRASWSRVPHVVVAPPSRRRWPMTSAGLVAGSRRTRPATIPARAADEAVARREAWVTAASTDAASPIVLRVVGAHDRRRPRRGTGRRCRTSADAASCHGGTVAPTLDGRDHSAGRATGSRTAGGRAARPAPPAPASRGRARPRTTSRTSASRHSPGRWRRAGRRRCPPPARARRRRCDPPTPPASARPPRRRRGGSAHVPPTTRRRALPAPPPSSRSASHHPPSSSCHSDNESL